MNIGIDIDGTYNKYPEFFNWLINIIHDSAGGKVYFITGLGHEKALERLKKAFKESVGDSFDDDVWFSHWFRNVTLVDTSLYNDEERALISKVESNEEIVGRFKQRMCKELNVDIMFDDQAAIHRQFGDTPIFEVK